MITRSLIQLPPHDGHPGLNLHWPEGCQPAFERGMERAQDWLDNKHSGWLWTTFLVERDWWPAGCSRQAFEIGFLSRIHQRLCSPLGGSHEARLAGAMLRSQ